MVNGRETLLKRNIQSNNFHNLHLQYCLINWGNFKGDNNLKLRDKLFHLQKVFVRIITVSHRLSHTDPLFAKLRILKIDDLYSQSVRMFSFHLFQDKLPGGRYLPNLPKG